MRQSKNRNYARQNNARDNVASQVSVPVVPENNPERVDCPLSVPPNPFDPAAFAVHTTVDNGIDIIKTLVTCPVRKPTAHEFVRVHPDQEYHLTVFILENKETQETYLLTRELATEFEGVVRTVTLQLAVNRQGVLFLWPVPAPKLDGRENQWWLSARIAAQKALRNWVRIIANPSANAYDVFTAQGKLADPVWPENSMSEILNVAFGERFTIRQMDHPVLRRLRGEE